MGEGAKPQDYQLYGWRRVFARFIDFTLWSLILSFLFGVVFGIISALIPADFLLHNGPFEIYHMLTESNRRLSYYAPEPPSDLLYLVIMMIFEHWVVVFIILLLFVSCLMNGLASSIFGNSLGKKIWNLELITPEGKSRFCFYMGREIRYALLILIFPVGLYFWIKRWSQKDRPATLFLPLVQTHHLTQKRIIISATLTLVAAFLNLALW